MQFIKYPVIASVVLLLSASVSFPEDLTVLKTQRDKVNYAIGVNLINNVNKQGIEIDLDLVIKGMKDASTGVKLLLNDDELNQAILQYQKAVRQNQGAKGKFNEAAANMKIGEAFLAANRHKEGVMTLPSGLQYKVLKEGEGGIAAAGNSMEYGYRCTLLNGREVLNSYGTGSPAAYKTKEDAIPGLGEALLIMPTGSKWRLFIPQQLAYGEQGDGKNIGPNTTLICEVELFAVK